MPKDPFTYKYRPKLLKDFQMNPELRSILNTLIAIEKLNLLLAGNSGSGKTSRRLARRAKKGALEACRLPRLVVG